MTSGEQTNKSDWCDMLGWYLNRTCFILQDQRDKMYAGEDKNQGSAKEKLT
jgi:hypothetical protein